MKKKYDIVFISTFINKSYIDKLISSVINNNTCVALHFIIVNQTISKLIFPESTLVDFFEINTERLSLSKARNEGLNYLLKNNISFDYIMFPDDDTTFDNQFFLKFKDVIGDNKNNFLIDVYGENSRELYIKNNLVDGVLVKKNKPRVAMSVNMLINMDTLTKVGLFDEKMGVGAQYGAGEDSDYFLRCVAYSGPFKYVKSMWNFHPKFEFKHKKFKLKTLMRKYKNYGKGEVYLLVKHRLYLSAIELCISALIGAFVALIKLNFKLFVARLYAFFIRSNTFLMLSLGIYK